MAFEYQPLFREYQPLFRLGKGKTSYRKLASDGVRIETFGHMDSFVLNGKRSGTWQKKR